jgi:oligopeptide/dipeptide ABC transporter ATP-binding protein
VMYLGRVVERASRKVIFSNPLHPYTLALLSAVPSTEKAVRSRSDRMRLQGDPPSPINLPMGCRFAARCPFAVDECRRLDPPLREVRSGHWAACHRVSSDGQPQYPRPLE